MTNEEIKKREIESALAAMNGGDFLQNSKNLLEVLNYHAPLTEELLETVDNFIHKFPAENENTKTEQEFRKNAKSIELVSQVGSDEIADSQPDRFESRTFDGGLIKSFVFCAVELKDKDYSRSKYAQFTREVNKRLPLATVVFFRVENRLTIGFVGRRQHKRDPNLDVLEQVSLIKDIRLDNPHPAHRDILFELSLDECEKWMADHKKQENFDGLLEAWLARLDTEPLNKEFYGKLFAWFEWAVEAATFPTDEKRNLGPEEHIIRLITRLLFVWFIKEKGLVAEELFNETQIRSLLKDYNLDTGDSYYRTVLQNLFFATLNTKIGERRFSKRTRNDHRNFSLYRYEDQITDPDKLRKLFEQTPFINGGLFDCLDNFKGTRYGGYRIDCFSDEGYTKLSIPNRLFFDDDRGLIPLLEHYKFTVEENTPIEQDVALDPELLGKVFENLLAAYNPETGETVRKQTGSYYTPRPIVDYMVEEALIATLTEQVLPTDGDAKFWDERLRYLFDYAKAFDDAREWFNDDETDKIVRAISELKILDPAVGSGAFPMGVLHKLTLALRRLDPDNTLWERLQRDRAGQRAAEVFDEKDDQTRPEELLEIDETFKQYRDSDFGRKLYLIQNSIFGVDIQPVACQIAKLRFFISLAIEQEPTQEADNNFGIKPLPNLETRFIAANTLIGLQLSETRLLLQEDAIQQLIKEIEGIREKRFLTNDRGQKLNLEEREDECREQLKEELESQREKWVENQQQEIERKVAQLPNPKHRKQLREVEQKEYEGRKKKFNLSFEDARKIASWKSYDQNASADWFDPEWMFGVREGFYVVIGNPPYIKEYTFKHAFDGLRESPYYQGKMDIWYMFACKGLDMVKNGEGVVTFIAQNNWVTSDGASKMRDKVIKDAQILSLIDFGSFKIFESGIQTMVMIFRQNTDSDSYSFDYRRLHGRDLNIKDVMSLLSKSDNSKAEYLTPTMNRGEYAGKSLTFSNPEVELILKKISLKGNFRLNPKKEVAQGIVYPQDTINKTSKNVLGNNFKVGDGIFVLSEKEKNQIPFTEKELDLIKPSYTTKELRRYYGLPINQEWLIYTDSSFKDKKKIEKYPNIKRHLDQFRKVITSDNKPYGLHRARNAYFFEGEKIISVRKCARPTFTWVDFDSYVSATFYVIKTARTNQKYLTGLLNSRLVTFWLKHRGKMQGTNYQVDKQPLLTIPLLSPSFEQQNSIETLVNQILDAKRPDPDADVSDLEKKIDQIVYLLYGLTPEEIDIVEGAKNV